MGENITPKNGMELKKILDWPKKIRLEEVAEYYNETKDMVNNDILEYGRPGEVHNNYTSGYGVEVNPERQKFDFATNLS